MALVVVLARPLLAGAQIAESPPEVQWTDPAEPALLAKANELRTAASIYEFVRNEFEFVLYHGAHSNSINTFLGRAGNDLDLASVLIAMLRSQRIPARYAVATVSVDPTFATRWLGVEHTNLPNQLLTRAGVPGVVLTATTLSFEHVWVQALVALDDYRGEGRAASIDCVATPASCRWVDLDPSLKDKVYPTASVDVYNALNFDYNALWHASVPGFTPQTNPEISREGKNPLEIFEEQVLTYIRSNQIGQTLSDVMRPGSIIAERAGLLPSSRPFVAGPDPAAPIPASVRTYDSVQAHDNIAAEPDWGRKLCLFVHYDDGFGGEGVGLPAGEATLADLSTKRLTITYDYTIQGLMTRLGGQTIATPNVPDIPGIPHFPVFGALFNLETWFVKSGDPCSQTIDSQTTRPSFPGQGTGSASFKVLGLHAGGYFDIGTGGETSNWSQLHRDAAALLASTQSYKVVNDGSGTPYYDADGNGCISGVNGCPGAPEKPLLESLPALDALTGGLLASARALYFARLHEIVTRGSALHHSVALIPGFVAVTSTVADVEYAGGRPFSVMPDGLLIDVAGAIDGPFRWDQMNAVAAPKAQELIGVSLSSLEHEIWQELTGFGATSTISGIQRALQQGASLNYSSTINGGTRHEDWRPSQNPVSAGGTAYLVFLAKDTDVGSGQILNITYAISQAGGGYLDLQAPALLANPDVFNNQVLTDQFLIGETNNDLIRTPSTTDPVSTVTGNLYYDATDVHIRGRGLDYLFTRTYNSGPTTNDTGLPLGFGWTHSYGMSLHSNNTGQEPNRPPPVGADVTSSITYRDERGGESIFGVSGSGPLATRPPVVPPRGRFETLDLSQAGAQKYLLKFRNGVEYEFGDADLSVPNRSAHLKVIRDAYGAYLTFHYDATTGDLDQISDNLGIPGRSGLTLHYVNHRLKWIRDWSSPPRQWTFDYDSAGNLTFYANPLGYVTKYEYQPGTHYLTAVVLPEDRNQDGTGDVRTGYGYYQDGKAFRNFNAFGQGEALEYNLFRHRTHVTDARGFTRAFYYNRNGELERLEEPDGGVLLFKNTAADGLRFEKTNALGFTTSYSYNSSRTITGCERDATPNCASDTYGNVTREQDAFGKQIDYDYDLSNFDQVTRVKDKRGKIQTFTFYSVDCQAPSCTTTPGAKKGRLYQHRATVNGTPDVLLEEDQWNSDGTLHSKVEYLDVAHPTRIRTTTYIYDPDSNGLDVQEIQVEGGGKTIRRGFFYDELGRIRQETLYRKRSYVDPTLVNLNTFYTHDALDRVTSVTDALNNRFETVYDKNGNPKESWEHWAGQGGDLRTAQRFYDEADRLIEERDVFGKATKFTYDEAGNLTKRVDRNGNTTRFEYDSKGRQTAVTDGNGHRTERAYDLAGRLISETDPNGIKTTFEYDQLDRLLAVSRPTDANDPTSIARTEYGYDANGNQVTLRNPNAVVDATVRNALGYTENRTYDEFNRVSRIYDAKWTSGEATLHYLYDLVGNRIAVFDALQQETLFQYDDLGQLATVRPAVPADAPATQTDFDEAGNVIRVVDREGQGALYTYDFLNRLTQVNYLTDNSLETREYDARGNLYSVGNSKTTYVFMYDDAHRLNQRTDQRTGAGSKSETYTYYDNGTIKTKKDFAGDTTEYGYDGANRLVTLRNPQYVSVSYHYDPAGRLLDRTLSNGAHTEYGYDLANRLVHLADWSLTGNRIQSLDFERDLVGNVMTVQDPGAQPGGHFDYTYDALNRLLQVDHANSAWDRCYTYDAVGNRLTEQLGSNTNCLSGTPPTPTHTFVYDPQNRLKEIHTGTASGPLYRSYQYNNNGSVKQIQDTPSGTYTLNYDPKNRLQSVAVGSNTTTFEYDPLDYRIKKVEAGKTYRYWLEGEHLDLVTGGLGEVLAKYFRGVVIDEVVNAYMRPNTGNTNDPFVNYTFHDDALQSVRALTDHTGDGTGAHLLAQAIYEPFGKLIYSAGTPPAPQLGYTGRELDLNTDGLYYYRARYYDPSIGRFLQEDPLGFAAGPNFYTYAENNPLIGSDPSGLDTLQFGVSGAVSVPLLNFDVPLAFGFAVDGNLHFGLFSTEGIGRQLGASANAGFSLQYSNAATISDLRGPFYNSSARGGSGFGGSFDWFTGDSPHGPVTGFGFTAGAAAGASASIFKTWTQVYAPLGDGSDDSTAAPTPESRNQFVSAEEYPGSCSQLQARPYMKEARP